jgi:cytochrome c biogenesis protein CcmG/thiol:disulfide interchange protein DsbE
MDSGAIGICWFIAVLFPLPDARHGIAMIGRNNRNGQGGGLPNVALVGIVGAPAWELRVKSLVMSVRLLVAALVCATVPAAARPKVGQPAPPFEVTTFDGQKITLADLRGQVVIVNIWATWCVPCRNELPLLDAYEKIRGDAGLRVVAVTTEDSVPLSALKPLAAHLTMKLAPRMRSNYQILEGVPTNYVIDRAGVLRYAKAEAFDLDSLIALLVPLLNERAPPPPAAIAVK